MPTQIFSSFEAYFDGNRHASVRGMVLGPEREDWVLTHLLVNNLSVQWGHAGAKVVVEGAPQPGGVTLFVPTQKPSGISGNGRRIDESSLMVVGRGDEFSIAADLSRRWCSLYVPNEALTDGDATTSVWSMHGLVQLPPHRVERFRPVVDGLGAAVERTPTAFKSATAQTATHHKLVREIRNLFAAPLEVEPTHGRHVVPRRQIIRMSMDFVDQHDGEYVSVEQLATAAGVSERTLREAFQAFPTGRQVGLANLLDCADR